MHNIGKRISAEELISCLDITRLHRRAHPATHSGNDTPVVDYPEAFPDEPFPDPFPDEPDEPFVVAPVAMVDVPVLQGPGIHIRDLVKESWGHFSIVVRKPTVLCKFGAWQAICKYHAKNRTTGCKKQVGLLSASDAHREMALNQIRHWCNQAKDYRRQEFHVGFNPTIAIIPPHDVLERDQIQEPPPDVAQTDHEIDMEGMSAEEDDDDDGGGGGGPPSPAEGRGVVAAPDAADSSTSSESDSSSSSSSGSD